MLSESWFSVFRFFRKSLHDTQPLAGLLSPELRARKKASCNTLKKRVLQDAFVRFPHAVFGAGQDRKLIKHKKGQPFSVGKFDEFRVIQADCPPRGLRDAPNYGADCAKEAHGQRIPSSDIFQGEQGPSHVRDAHIAAHRRFAQQLIGFIFAQSFSLHQNAFGLVHHFSVGQLALGFV